MPIRPTKIIGRIIATSLIASNLTYAAEAGDTSLKLRMNAQAEQTQDHTKTPKTKLRLKKRTTSGSGKTAGAGLSVGGTHDYSIRAAGANPCVKQGSGPGAIRMVIKNEGTGKNPNIVPFVVEFYNTKMQRHKMAGSGIPALNPGEQVTVQLKIPADSGADFADGYHWKFRMSVNYDIGLDVGIPYQPESKMSNNTKLGECWLAVK